ncbi:hypothetical protein QQF64_003335 [Cirrhinus molitorella]|uniref:Uncharacterized protein n=1 Tax=Cirrhinus molitorella TaxID=172907 RepID=A0ABR3ML02_9TELE
MSFQSHIESHSHWHSVSGTPVALVCVCGSQLPSSSPNIPPFLSPLSIFIVAPSFRSHGDACVTTPGALWAVAMVTVAGFRPIGRRRESRGESVCLCFRKTRIT